MLYDPENYSSRRHLASELCHKLESCGFTEIQIPGTHELVYARDVDGREGIRVLVYTTVSNGAARACGKDAIRVCAVYRGKDGRERGIARDRRVNRVGASHNIVRRMHGRMRDVYRAALHPERCHCGAPKFLSQAGNSVCADLCWTNLPEMIERIVAS